MRVLFFGNLRELAGTAVTTIPANIKFNTVEELAEHITAGNTALKAVLYAQTTKVAIDAKFADFSSGLNDAKEIAFMPPFSGG